MVVKCRVFFLGYIFSIILSIILAVTYKSDVLFLSLIILWLSTIFYSLEKIKQRLFYFIFSSVFFVFIMGRETLIQFSLSNKYVFSKYITRGVYIQEIITILCIFIFYIIFERISNMQNLNTEFNLDFKNLNKKYVSKVSKYTFYILFIFSIIYEIKHLEYLWEIGYAKSYVVRFINTKSIYILYKFSEMMPISFYIYCATFPEKKDAKYPMGLYFLYLFLSLGSGSRNTFILGIIFFVFYLLLRNKIDKGYTWIRKRTIILGFILCPLLIVFLSAYNYYRFGENISDINFSLFDWIKNFFINQGITGKVLKYSKLYNFELFSDKLYNSIFLKNGIISRLFDIPVFSGNSVDKALYSGDFMHALSYKILGNEYLQGRGTGSSYISELYQDFKYIGIVLGSIIYAFFINKIDKIEKSRNIFSISLKFIILIPLLWASRASYTGFIKILISPTTIFIMIFIFGLSKLLEIKKGIEKKIVCKKINNIYIHTLKKSFWTLFIISISCSILTGVIIKYTYKPMYISKITVDFSGVKKSSINQLEKQKEYSRKIIFNKNNLKSVSFNTKIKYKELKKMVEKSKMYFANYRDKLFVVCIYENKEKCQEINTVLVKDFINHFSKYFKTSKIKYSVGNTKKCNSQFYLRYMSCIFILAFIISLIIKVLMIELIIKKTFKSYKIIIK